LIIHITLLDLLKYSVYLFGSKKLEYIVTANNPFCVIHPRTSRGSVVKAADLRPASLDSTPSSTDMSHWWWQEGAKPAGQNCSHAPVIIIIVC